MTAPESSTAERTEASPDTSAGTTAPTEPDAAPATGRIRAKARLADRVFSGAAMVAGALILVALAAVAIFLIAQALPALTADPAEVSQFVKRGAASFWEYVLPLVLGTVWAALLALIIALPLSLGIALFISHYAPRRAAQALGYVIDLLAAVPSVVFGLWGIKVLAPAIAPLYGWLVDNLGWLPFFAGTASTTGRTILTVAIVLAVMIIPIITALCREVFLQTPRLHEEAALALGETMVVAMVLSPGWVISLVLTSSENMPTIAGNIALQFPEAAGLDVNALIATGLVLFVITLAVNSAARWVIARRAAFSGAN